jgi:uncharacterized protein (TIGR02611 family)
VHDPRDDLAAEQPAATPTEAPDRKASGPTVVDEAARGPGLRDFVRRHRGLELVYRAGVAVLGVAIVIAGIALIPLPGPGWLVVFAGLAVLATEFAWAERLLHRGRDMFRAWTAWVMRQPLVVRALLGLGGLALVMGAAALYVAMRGVPGWLPVIG